MCDECEHKAKVEWDDVTGDELDPQLVEEGCKEELEMFKRMKVYEYVLRRDAQADAEGKMVGVRWVKTKKGTKEKPKIRCRLVAQEFADREFRDDLFAGTPPLAAMRMIISEMASRGKARSQRMKIKVMDIKKAFLHGTMNRKVYIELPAEDPWAKDGNYVGLLKKAMYGTRDAPVEWQRVVQETLQETGFTMSKVVPCLYYNERK